MPDLPEIEINGETFCVNCGKHFPVGENGEFVWESDGTWVGS